MALAVLSVAYPFAPVRPDTAGGAEHVLALLDRALVKAGHRSVVVACRGSEVEGLLVESPWSGKEGVMITAGIRRSVQEQQRLEIHRALESHDIGLVHMHGIDFDCYMPQPGVPVLATLHLPLPWYSPEALKPKRPGTYLHCVSASQRAACPAGVALLPDIENGVPVERLRTKVGKRDFVISLGRICPEKGFHIALDAAGRAGTAMLLAGEVYPYEAHAQYYSGEILPRIDGRRRRFIGPIGFERKRRLLTAARCLLVPSLVPETSSLAAMEALACGTPVVAFPAGALADIVEDGRTGFLVHDEYEMSEAIGAALSLDPGECRRAARERFSSDAMTGRYFELYERLSLESPVQS